MKSFLFGMLFLITACGESPLLNHELESNKILTKNELIEFESLQFSKTNFSFSVFWEEGPRLGQSRFVMKTWDKNLGTFNGPYQNLNKELHIFLWMPSMGHGSVPVKITQTGQGEYIVSDVQFIMGGRWEIKFQLKESDQVLDETVISIPL